MVSEGGKKPTEFAGLTHTQHSAHAVQQPGVCVICLGRGSHAAEDLQKATKPPVSGL